MVSAAGALDSEGGKGQEAMDMDSSKPTKKIPRNRFVIAYAVLASTISILIGYGMFGVLDWNRRPIRWSGYDKFRNFYVGMEPVNCVLGAEIFPLRLRAKAASIGVAVNRGISEVVSMTFLSISRAMTVRQWFSLVLAVSVLCPIFIYFCVLESFPVKPQEYLDKMETDPSVLEPGNRRGIPVKAETGGAVTITGGAVNVTGAKVNVTVATVTVTGGGVNTRGGAVNTTGGAVTGGGAGVAVTSGGANVTGGEVTVTGGVVTVTGGAVNVTGGAAGGAVTGGAVTGWLVTGGVLTGGAVTGGAVTGGAGEAVTGGAVTGGEVIGTVVIGGVLTGGAATGGAVTGGVFQ